jgi:hypothetical protein
MPAEFEGNVAVRNLLNQVNFLNPDNTVTDPTLGQLLVANQARQIHFSLKLFW